MNATVTPISADVGIYLHDGGVYRVRQSRASHGRYAEGLVVEGGRFLTGRWVYVPGQVTVLREAPRLTLAGAVELGRILGVCVVCGNRLPGTLAGAGIHSLCRANVGEARR